MEWNKYDDWLMKVVERGDVEKVFFIFVKKGVYFGKLDVEGRLVFYVVVFKGNLECLNVIFMYGIDVVIRDSVGRNVFYLVVKYGYVLCL